MTGGGPAPSPPPGRGSLRAALAALAMLLPAAARPAGPDAAQPPGAAMLSPGRSFAEGDGASLYANTCQGCHMPDGRGASGAASYPALAGDANLASAAFTTAVVVKGLNAMPAVGRAMSDEQVAAVVNYVRGHFGNGSDAPVTPADARAARD